MYDNLRICCRTCGFNGFNENSVKDSPEKAGDFFCKVRQFELKYPTWTLCKNHPIYNPLRVMEPRGPIWAAVNIIYDSQPLNADVMIPPEFVPPQGDGTHFFIPYYENVRPLQGEEGACELCGKSLPQMLYLPFLADKAMFCCVAHYFEWWLRSAPSALTPRSNPVSEQNEVENRLRAVPELLLGALEVLRSGDNDWMRDVLREIEEILFKLRSKKMVLLHSELCQEDPDFQQIQFLGEFSPNLQIIQTELVAAAELLHREEASYEFMCNSVSEIVKAVSGYLKIKREVFKLQGLESLIDFYKPSKSC